MAFLKITSHALHLEWRIERPERGNGLGTSLAEELSLALHALPEASVGKSVLVLTATPVVKGERRTWVAGGDLKELAGLQSREEAEAYAGRLSAVCRGLARSPLPVIVAIDGAAIGGGAELALAGDMRLATAASCFEWKQLKVGLPTGYGSAQRLTALVGLARAQDLLFGCKTLDAREAHALGLVSEVCDDEAALARSVERWASHFASLAPEAVAAQKAMLWHAAYDHPGSVPAAELRAFKGAWRNSMHGRFLSQFLGGRGK